MGNETIGRPNGSAARRTHEDARAVELADLVTPENICNMIPGRPNRSTVFRWALKGCRGIRLRTLKVGGRRVTSSRWVMEFAEAVEAARLAAKEPPKKYRPRKRRKPKSDEAALEGTADVLRRFGLA